MKHRIGAMLARAMINIRGNARTVERLERDLQELTSAAQDVVNVIAPLEDGADPRSLVKRLRVAPGRVAELCKIVCKQVLAVVKSYYLRADLLAAGDGIARDYTEDAYVQYLEEAEPIAVKMTEFITLEDP